MTKLCTSHSTCSSVYIHTTIQMFLCRDQKLLYFCFLPLEVTVRCTLLYCYIMLKSTYPVPLGKVRVLLYTSWQATMKKNFRKSDYPSMWKNMVFHVFWLGFICVWTIGHWGVILLHSSTEVEVDFGGCRQNLNFMVWPILYCCSTQNYQLTEARCNFSKWLFFASKQFTTITTSKYINSLPLIYFLPHFWTKFHKPMNRRW